MTENYSDAALVLAGHGSTVNTDSGAPVFQHALTLRQRKIFAGVHEAFWKQAPYLAETVRNITAPRVFIVPLFISDGYFTSEAIPMELGLCQEGRTDFARVQQRGGQTVFYCSPIGTHESMTEVLLARAAEIVRHFPFPHAPKPSDISLFIAGHGTSRNENSRKAIEHHVDLIQRRKIYAEVFPVFMEEEPRIAECYKLAKNKNIVMVPFFISDGMHTFEDIPVMLGEPERLVRARRALKQTVWRNPTERNGQRLWYASSIGNEAHIPDVILQRVSEVLLPA